MRNFYIYSTPILFVGSVGLVVMQFDHYSLMWQTGLFMTWIGGVWCMMMALVGWVLHKRTGNIQKYITEWALIGLAILPLVIYIVTLFNQLGKGKEEVPFTFSMEQGIRTAALGMLKGESLKATKFRLITIDQDSKRRSFTYKNGPLYPLTQSGETIALPMRQGWLGVDWVELDGQ
jgi:hypothetical protein